MSTGSMRGREKNTPHQIGHGHRPDAVIETAKEGKWACKHVVKPVGVSKRWWEALWEADLRHELHGRCQAYHAIGLRENWAFKDMLKVRHGASAEGSNHSLPLPEPNHKRAHAVPMNSFTNEKTQMLFEVVQEI